MSSAEQHHFLKCGWLISYTLIHLLNNFNHISYTVNSTKFMLKSRITQIHPLKINVFVLVLGILTCANISIIYQAKTTKFKKINMMRIKVFQYLLEV